MPEISEGNLLEWNTKYVFPDGEVGEVVGSNAVGTKARFSIHGENKDRVVDDNSKSDLVKVDQPIRVRVSRESYAESLVALAEENDFSCIDATKENTPDGYYLFLPESKDNEQQVIHLAPLNSDVWCYNADLTYAQDLPQIEAWLQANRESEERSYSQRKPHRQEQDPIPDGQFDNAPESEDECEYGCEDGAIFEPDVNNYLPCPDCTDESEDYSEPWCERETHHEQGTPEHRLGKLSFFTQEKVDDYSGFEARPFELFLMDYIDDLESEIQSIKELCHEYGLPENEPDGSCNEVKLTEFIRSQFQELQDCWENQKEYKNDVAELQEQLQEVRKKRNYWQGLCEAKEDARQENDDLRHKYKEKRVNLQERIEEARGLAKDHLSAQHKVEVNGLAKDILEILSDSDEGDGCGE